MLIDLTEKDRSCPLVRWVFGVTMGQRPENVLPGDTRLGLRFWHGQAGEMALTDTPAMGIGGSVIGEGGPAR